MMKYHVLFLIILSCIVVSGFSRNLPITAFDEGYSHLFGDNNLMILNDGKSAHISLDKRTGAGFVSQDLYLHGYFSASIKLPADYTAGVVVAFYMSNGDMFEKNHDEIDFEFLGNIRGKDWRIQTNIYGNGSTNVGREERYGLWFDPSEDFHQYSILWTENLIIKGPSRHAILSCADSSLSMPHSCRILQKIHHFWRIRHALADIFEESEQYRFYVDNVPIREIKRTKAMGGDFPSKPMSLIATIWDGSNWATNGGKYKVNYKYAPYTAKFSDFILHGCAVDPVELSSKCDDDAAESKTPSGITLDQRRKMDNFRKKQMQYSYCYDMTRYNVPPPECVIDSKEAERLRAFDPVRFGGSHHHHGKRHRRRSKSKLKDDDDVDVSFM